LLDSDTGWSTTATVTEAVKDELWKLRFGAGSDICTVGDSMISDVDIVSRCREKNRKKGMICVRYYIIHTHS